MPDATVFWIFISIILGGGILVALAFVIHRELTFRNQAAKREAHMKSRLYELAILKELQDRFGYSLNVEKIVDIISGSLGQFIQFSVVSYILIEPERLYFKCHLNESLPQAFIDEVKERMIASLKALLGDDVVQRRHEEMVTGAIMTDEIEASVQSFFNIPLSIKDRIVGVLNVASSHAGLYQEDQMTIIYKIVKQASQAVQRLEEVLDIEQEKVNAMVASLSDGLLMVDSSFRVVTFNPRVRQIFALQEQKEISIFDFIDALSGKVDIRGKLEESVKLDKLIQVNDVMLGNRFYEISIAPVTSIGASISEKQLFGAVVLFHDITSEKEIERLRQDFTSMMVHELRSPLDGIKKMSSIMLNRAKDNAEVVEFLQMVNTSSGDMLTLVSDLLDVAKIEAGKFAILPETKDFLTILTDRFEFFKNSQKDILFELANYVQSPYLISFDELRIKQVLNNLLSNAFKYTRPNIGKEGIRITLNAFEHHRGTSIDEEARAHQCLWFGSTDDYRDLQDSLVIGISDRGIGIPEAKRGELFNKFKQLSTKSQERGTGLGLIIAKAIVEAHGGVVAVGSEEDRGSTFFFTLPRS